MKIFLMAAASIVWASLNAQTTVSYPAKAGQPVVLKFDYPVVRVNHLGKK